MTRRDVSRAEGGDAMDGEVAYHCPRCAELVHVWQLPVEEGQAHGGGISPVAKPWKGGEASRAKGRRKSQKKTKRRPCLRCDKVFRSEGSYHRLCGRCRDVLARETPGYASQRTPGLRAHVSIERSP
jgi:uncharacterized C2H2 Zn-finger protein